MAWCMTMPAVIILLQSLVPQSRTELVIGKCGHVERKMKSKSYRLKTETEPIFLLTELHII